MARKANSLTTLLAQVDALHPGRSKTSDGWIGDRAHAKRKSDHNPNSAGVVCAIDVTGEPGHQMVEDIRLSRDPRAKYAISKGRMWSSYPKGDYPPFTWRPYSGSNPHDKHAHLSVQGDPALYDDHRQWALTSEDTVTGPKDVAYFQKILARAYPERDGKGPPYDIAVDGQLGPQTKAAIEDWQTRRGLEVTGTLNIATCCSLQSHANLAYVDRS